MPDLEEDDPRGLELVQKSTDELTQTKPPQADDPIYEQLDQEYENLVNKITINEQTKAYLQQYNRMNSNQLNDSEYKYA